MADESDDRAEQYGVPATFQVLPPAGHTGGPYQNTQDTPPGKWAIVLPLRWSDFDLVVASGVTAAEAAAQAEEFIAGLRAAIAALEAAPAREG